MTASAKHSSKRRRIMEVAARRFSSQGYANTRMAEVAADLDMKAGSLYYYFDSKEALLSAIVESNVGLASDALQLIVAADGSVRDKVRDAIESHLAIFAEHSDLYKIFVNEKLHEVVPELAARVDEVGRGYEGLWVGLIDAGVAAGELRTDLDPWIAMKAIVGLCNSVLFWYSPAGSIEPGRLADEFASLVWDGVAKPKSKSG